MDNLELVKKRHSVRKYKDIPIEEEKVFLLLNEIKKINEESCFNFQLILNEPEAFNGNAAHYGSFKGCKNYFALVGKAGEDEKIGYYGERLVLFSQSIGLNTCWVALTYKKGKVKVDKDRGEKLYVVISLGYGENRGVRHKGKHASDVSNVMDESPEWFKRGVESALLSPTAMNQQKFYLEYIEDYKVKAKNYLGFYSRMDLGIVKYHFEFVNPEIKIEWI